MIKIKINGVTYDNVASVSPSVVYDVVYNVKTMDGRIHRKINGLRTNYNIVFFNKNLAEYDELKEMLLYSNYVTLEIPDGASTSIYGEYLPTVSNDNFKGLLWNEQYYHTALSVMFEKVGYDTDE